jgi:hypothetical protein
MGAAAAGGPARGRLGSSARAGCADSAGQERGRAADGGAGDGVRRRLVEQVRASGRGSRRRHGGRQALAA